MQVGNQGDQIGGTGRLGAQIREERTTGEVGLPGESFTGRDLPGGEKPMTGWGGGSN